MMMSRGHSPDGPTVKLVRLLTDGLYHNAGSILALAPADILPDRHKIIEVNDPNVEPLAKLVMDLAERVAALEAAQTPASDAPAEEPEAAPAPKTKAKAADAAATT